MAEPPVSDVYAELEWRGMIHQVTDDALGEKLAAEPFTLYIGFDATADSLHVGSLLPIRALQHFQRAGHRPLVLLGGGTSLIGDPSGKEAERPLLSLDDIEANANGIRGQLESFIEFGSGPSDALLVNNADWLCSLPLTDFLRDVGRHVSVNVMMAKESVRARLEGREQGISYAEFSYMLLQAYDYLHLLDTHGCRLQVGASDQWGNITAGVELIRRVRSAEAYGLTWPLLTKADGTKFGKSEGGNVWLDPARTSPYRFFQHWMQVEDRDVGHYLRLLTLLDRQRIEALEAATLSRPAQREAQRVLASTLTADVHGPAQAEAAARASEALFGGALDDLDADTLAELFAEAPATVVPRDALADAGVSLVELLADTGLVASRSQARTSVEQGGVYVNNRREDDLNRRLGRADLLPGDCIVLRRGKRSYHVVKFR